MPRLAAIAHVVYYHRQAVAFACFVGHGQVTFYFHSSKRFHAHHVYLAAVAALFFVFRQTVFGSNGSQLVERALPKLVEVGLRIGQRNYVFGFVTDVEFLHFRAVARYRAAIESRHEVEVKCEIDAVAGGNHRRLAHRCYRAVRVGLYRQGDVAPRRQGVGISRANGDLRLFGSIPPPVVVHGYVPLYAGSVRHHTGKGQCRRYQDFVDLW